MDNRFYWEHAGKFGQRIEIKDRTHAHGDQVIAEVWDATLAETIVQNLIQNPKTYITERHSDL